MVADKAAGVIHWVSATHGVPATIRRYNNLFSMAELPSDTVDIVEHVNPSSLEEFQGVVEPSVAERATAGRGKQPEGGRRCWFQFEREGYYALDERLDADGVPVEERGEEEEGLAFNLVVGLRQGKGKVKGKGKPAKQGNGKQGKGKQAKVGSTK